MGLSERDYEFMNNFSIFATYLLINLVEWFNFVAEQAKKSV